jgi:hypothetical protein
MIINKSVFGFLYILAEIKKPIVDVYFKFIRTFLGRGFFNIL